MRELAPRPPKTVALQKVVAHVHALAIRRLRPSRRYITMAEFTISTSGTITSLKVAAHAVALVSPTF